jgi:ubiquinone/menaquinone biosynthesis C-methylase UbiE
MLGEHVTKTIATYDQIADSYARNTEEHLPTRELEQFIAMMPPGGKILDAGCGPGRDSAFFTRHGFEVVGVDLSEKLLEIARTRVPTADFQKQDLRDLQFPPQSFAGIWASASLLHLDRNEIPEVLSSFYDLLTSGGVLFVMVKAGQGEAEVSEAISSGLTRHFTYFDREEIKNLLTESGFMIDQLYSWNEKDRSPQLRDVVFISGFATKNI